MLCWIPSHVNIPRNEKADCAAKSALSLPVTNMRFSAYDLAPRVSKFCLKEWQDIWDACQGNKLYAIYPNVGGYQDKSSLSRQDAVLINRLRIDNTRLTHSYLLSGDDQPVCSACQSPLTVEHFLIECVNFAAIRSMYSSASSMKDVFEYVNAQSVIDFIREIHFYHEL